MRTNKPINIDACIAGFSAKVQAVLEQVRATIQKTAPTAEEAISYGMPSIKLNGKALVYFAAFKNHIGFYALPSGNDAFKKELSLYKTGKDSIQLPLSEPMPLDLIRKIVEFRIQENSIKTSKKK